MKKPVSPCAVIRLTACLLLLGPFIAQAKDAPAYQIDERNSYFENGYIASKTFSVPYFSTGIYVAGVINGNDISQSDIYYRLGDTADLDRNQHLKTDWQKVKENVIPRGSSAAPFVQIAVQEADFLKITMLRLRFMDDLRDFLGEKYQSKNDWNARLSKKGADAWRTEWTGFGLHHTAGHDYTTRHAPEGVQELHMDQLKWSDGGYHFGITTNGSIFEIRPLFFQGAHAKGHNHNNIGITAFGCFDDKECDGNDYPKVSSVTEPLVRSFGELIGFLAFKQNISVSRDNIKGHREFTGAKTACPGSRILNYMEDIVYSAKGTLEQLKRNY